MSEAEYGEVEDQQVRCGGLDGGSGTQCLQLGSDWVVYLAGAELPGNVTGVDYNIPDIPDFGEAEWTNA